MRSVRTMMMVGLVLTVTVVAAAAASEDDARTTLEVKLALLDRLGADSLHVDVETTGGEVALKGTVNKRETMELAETIAKSVKGVRGVENDIRVGTVAPSTTGAAVTEAEAEVKDAILSSKVRLTLIDKMGSDGFKIGTDVANGTVTLEFDASLPSERRQTAMAAVKAVEGVSKVLSVDKK